jgi:hypothetical protein
MRTVRWTAAVLTTCAAVVASVLVAGPGQAADWEQAQRRLNVLGCGAGPANGTVGAHTRSAVVRFQAANRLAQAGRLTEATRTRLYADRQIRCDARPVPGAAKGRRIVVSQRQNYVWLVRSNGHIAAQGAAVDSPGLLARGRYRSGSKCGRAAKIRNNTDLTGRLRLHSFTRFAPCGIGFHQIPRRWATGAQIHPDYLLGTDRARSHGCIRVSRSMADRIWDFASAGTLVVVVR